MKNEEYSVHSIFIIIVSFVLISYHRLFAILFFTENIPVILFVDIFIVLKHFFFVLSVLKPILFINIDCCS